MQTPPPPAPESRTDQTGPSQDRPVESSLRRAIQITVLYADLFEYPLTEGELYRRLIEHAPDRDRFEDTLQGLIGETLSRNEGYVCWRGRKHLARVRRERSKTSLRHWPVARRYARWMRWIPFVRMVAVSGALALDNAQEEGDVDVFCVTDPNRLWLARLWLVPIARWTRADDRFCPLDLCPNYLLTTETLRVERQNLFTAYETVQSVPIWGHDLYRRFRDANAWTRRFLPGMNAERNDGAVRGGSDSAAPEGRAETTAEASSDAGGESPIPGKPLPTRAVEWLLGGRLGDLLDRWLHRISLRLFRRRAERRGWDWEAIRPAYRRNRYTVPLGGYDRVIEDLLERSVSDAFDPEMVEDLLERLFPERSTAASTRSDPSSARYDWDGLFRRDYDPDEPAA